MWYVYILECSDGSLYTGSTNDLVRRLKQHNDGKGAKYTRMRKPLKMVYNKEMGDRSSAMKEEIRIKRLTRLKKIKLINNE